ncbi:MAG: PAS domain S-box protein [Acidobacteriota bacterium]|nr:PAS domain S-box protein [Acidobacteriota bacterium]
MSLETNRNFVGTRIGIEQDITKRKQAQDARNQSRRYLQALFDNSLDGILVINDEACYIDANPAACAQLGYIHEELIQLSILDLTPAPYHQEVRELWAQLLERDTQNGEYPVVCKDGKVIQVEFRTVSNILSGIHVAFIRDITERKRAEEALRASEERYRELFESARDAIYVHDLKGVYVSVNRAAEKLSGYSREQIIGKHFTDFLAPEQVDQVRRKLAGKLVAQQEASYVVEVIARDGRRVPVEVNSNLIYEDGAPVAVQGLVRDITERLSAEQAIRHAEQKYRDIFENAGEGIFQSTPEGQFLDANPALARMLGYDSPKELISSLTDISTQIYVDAKRREVFRNLLIEEGMVRGFEEQVLRKDGSKIWISVNARAVRDAQGRLIYHEGTAQDITERKRGEAALRNYSRLLIEAQEAERQKIARELHDQIGQVLTAVRINLHNIQKSCETAETRSLIDEGMGMVDQALEQVRDLSFELRPSVLDDLGLIAALGWYADRYTQRTGIRTTLVTDLAVDQIRLRKELETTCFRIVQEALTNVARHARAKNISINLVTLNHDIVLTIKDDGIGFDEPSTNGTASASRLGLRGMKERALALGGRLEIKSSSARGTEIRACF